MYILRGEGFEFLCRSEDLDRSCTETCCFMLTRLRWIGLIK